jgi:hypothetical protein
MPLQTCPICGRTNADHAAYCAFDGHELRAGESDGTARAIAQVIVLCERCGRPATRVCVAHKRYCCEWCRCPNCTSIRKRLAAGTPRTPATYDPCPKALPAGADAKLFWQALYAEAAKQGVSFGELIDALGRGLAKNAIDADSAKKAEAFATLVQIIGRVFGHADASPALAMELLNDYFTKTNAAARTHDR